MSSSTSPNTYNKSFSFDFGKDINGVLMLHHAKSMHPMYLWFCHHQHRGMHDPDFLGN